MEDEQQPNIVIAESQPMEEEEEQQPIAAPIAPARKPTPAPAAAPIAKFVIEFGDSPQKPAARYRARKSAAAAARPTTPVLTVASIQPSAAAAVTTQPKKPRGWLGVTGLTDSLSVHEQALKPRRTKETAAAADTKMVDIPAAVPVVSRKRALSLPAPAAASSNSSRRASPDSRFRFPAMHGA